MLKESRFSPMVSSIISSEIAAVKIAKTIWYIEESEDSSPKSRATPIDTLALNPRPWEEVLREESSYLRQQLLLFAVAKGNGQGRRVSFI